MQRRLTPIVFFALVGVLVVTAVRVAGIELGGSATFGRAELEAWLTARELDQTPVTLRRAARQLDRDFHVGHDWQPTFEAQPKSRQPAFAQRFELLLTLLVRQRADAYRETPRHRREAFLDQQMQDLATWYVVGPRGKTTASAIFQRWLHDKNASLALAAAPPQVREFMTALQAHVVKRTLKGVFPLGGDGR